MLCPHHTSRPETNARDRSKTTAMCASNVRREGRVAGSSGILVFAGAEFLQFLTPAGDLEALSLQLEAELVADLVFEFLNLLAVELDNFVAVLADDVAVIGMIGVVGVVKFVVLAEVHLAHQPALG